MDRREVRVTGIKVTSLATFEGVFAGVIGFAVGLVAWLGLTFHYADATNSLLRGLIWGMVPGLFALIITTLVYFAVGWIIGAIHGLIFNLVAEMSGGLVASREEQAPAAPMRATGGATRRAEPSFGETVDKRRID
jgi:hypothetical protein